MKRVTDLPTAFKRHKKMGGVLHFVVFDEAEGGEDEVVAAVPEALVHGRSFDAAKLRELGYRRINEKAFFGDWYDRQTGMLIKRGSYTNREGKQLNNPVLRTLTKNEIVSGAGRGVEAGAGGQFAYAFSTTPYGLHARPAEVQEVFDEIRDFILPAPHWSEIWDWASPRLPEVSDYFQAGMEWWGVFLFSIHIPGLRRLTIIAGSTTD